MGNDVLTLQEVADLLGKSTQTVRRMIKKGDLKAQRIKTSQGFQYGIYRAQIEAETAVQASGYAPTHESTPVTETLGAGQAVDVQRNAEKQHLTSQLVTPFRQPLVTAVDVQSFLGPEFFEKELQRMLETQHREKMTLLRILELMQMRLMELENELHILRKKRGE